MSRDDTERLAAQASAATLRDNLNQTNIAANSAKIAVVSQAITALPAPVNAAARALGEGLYAAFKTRVDGVRQPAPASADPIKLMAYAMAFAILRALWCFLKSVLNPLPFIGSFFPLCPNDPDATSAEANNDTENRQLSLAASRFDGAIGNGTQEAYAGPVGLGTGSDPSQSFERPDGPSPLDSGGGITFDEYVSATAGIGSGSEIGSGLSVQQSKPEPAVIDPASFGLPVTPSPEPQATPSQALSENPRDLSFDNLRRGFGL